MVVASATLESGFDGLATKREFIAAFEQMTDWTGRR